MDADVDMEMEMDVDGSPEVDVLPKEGKLGDEENWEEDDDGWGDNGEWDGTEFYEQIVVIPKEPPPRPSLPLKTPGMEETPKGGNVREENPLDEGQQERNEKSSRTRPRSWVCKVCKTLNRMVVPSCIKCSYSRDVINDPVVDQEPVIELPAKEEETLYEVWECPACHLHNNLSAFMCAECKTEITSEVQTLARTFSFEMPPKPVEDSSFNLDRDRDRSWERNYVLPEPQARKVHNVERNRNEGREEMEEEEEEAKPIHKKKINLDMFGKMSHPSAMVRRNPRDLEKVVVDMFGEPYQNAYMNSSFSEYRRWGQGEEIISHIGATEVDLIDSHAETQIFHPVAPRGFAFDAFSSHFATTNARYLCIWESKDSQWKLAAEPLCIEDIGVTINTVRVRMCSNVIFVMNTANHRIFRFEKSGPRRIELRGTIYDPYFTTVNVVDFDIVSLKTLVVLFTRWFGVYDIKSNNECQWRHGIAYARETKLFARSFKVIAGDFNETEAEEKHESVEKFSHKYYMYVAANQSLLAVHPSVPSFEFLNIAEITNNEKQPFIFAPSMRYGVFYISPDRQRLYQSPDLNNETKTAILDVNVVDFPSVFDKPNVPQFNTEHFFSSLLSLEYDEIFGISGRLLVYGVHKNNNHAFVQFFNLKELEPLMDVWIKNPHLRNSLLAQEKADFNLTTEVYLFLYGKELLTSLAKKQAEMSD